MSAIHEAVKANDIGAIGRLLDNGVSIEEKEHGFTPLMNAVSEASDATLSFLIARGAQVEIKNHGMTPLILAAMHGYDGAAKLLMKAGADPNVCDSKGLSPLMHAAKHGGSFVVQALIAGGADVGLKDNKDRTALDIASDGGNAGTAFILMRAGAEISETALFAKKDVLKIGWLRNDASLIGAAELCDTMRLADLLADPLADRNVRDKSGRDLLSIASVWGCLETVELLIDLGFDVNARSTHSRSVLFLAAQAGQREVVRLLLSRGADPLARSAQEMAPLTRVAVDHRIPVLTELLQFAQQNGIALDIDAAEAAAKRDGQREALRTLRSFRRQPDWTAPASKLLQLWRRARRQRSGDG